MGISTWWEFWFIGIPVVAFGSFALIWSVPGVVMGSIVSFGSLKHIIFIDKELAKDLNKYYDHNGHMRPQYQMTWAVGSRCFDYWMMYLLSVNVQRHTLKNLDFLCGLMHWACGVG